MGKKRKNASNHYAAATDTPSSSSSNMGVSPSLLPPLPKFGVKTFTLTSAIPSSTRPPSPPADDNNEDDGVDGDPKDGGGKDKGGEWQVQKKHKHAKRQKQKKAGDGNYPEFRISPQRLQRKINIADLQNLMLWLVADGTAQQWLLVRHKPEIRRVVVVMVPGLTMDMFDGTLLTPEKDAKKPTKNKAPADEDDVAWEHPKKKARWENSVPTSVDEYFPSTLDRDKLAPCVADLADMFTHVWPVKALGDDRYMKVHSPIGSFLKSPIPKNMEPLSGQQPRNRRLLISQVIMTLEQLVEDKYPLHSSQLAQQRLTLGLEETPEDLALLETRQQEGWVETDLTTGNNVSPEAGSILEGKSVYALDCEMCETASGLELTRISVLDWSGEVVYDTLVKPSNAITNYLTQFSGITEARLESCTTTLKDVQTRLLALLNNDSILLGQSLNSDLAALKLVHPHIIDTSVLYHHTRGPPYKPSLKWLAQKFLKREIQSTTTSSSTSTTGHDSIEDALACLDLVKLKLEKGLQYGTVDSMSEPVFRRLSRQRPPRTGAVVDYGDPAAGLAASAHRIVQAKSDDDVVAGVIRCASGDEKGTRNGHGPADFVWGRLRLIENARGFARNSGAGGGGSAVADGADGADGVDGVDGGKGGTRGLDEEEMAGGVSRPALAETVAAAVANLKKIYEGLPPCSALMVYSGTGDPRPMRRMQDLQRTFRDEYRTRKWDELSVKWTDTEEQALKAAVAEARSGVAFLTVK